MVSSVVNVWALETANRVRMLQASWADDDAVSRAETVRQELQRALAAFSGAERSVRLAALKAHFPTWNQGEVKVVEVEGPARKPTPQAALEQLLQAFPTLNDRERQQFSQKLHEAGYKIEKVTEVKTAALPEGLETLPESTARKLGLKASVRVYPTQVFSVLHELLDCLLTVSTLAQGVMQEMYRRADISNVPRDEEGQVRLAIGRYLSGEASSSQEQMRLAVAKVRIKLAGMLQIPGALPVRMCERLKPCHPESVELTVDREMRGGKFLKDKKVLCWEKYSRLLWPQQGLGQVEGSEFWDLDFAKDIVAIVEGPGRNG